MKPLDRKNKDKFTLWRRRHDVSKWSGVETSIRDLEAHEHPEDKRYGSLIDRVVQIYTTVAQALIGLTQLNFNGEDRVDADQYAHPAAPTVTVSRTGWYRVTTGINASCGHRSRVLINGIPNLRSVAWERDSEDRVCQVFANVAQAVVGLTVLNFDGNTHVDNIFTHNPVTPEQVTVLADGMYRITTGINVNNGHRTRVLINGVPNQLSVAWDR